MTQTDKHIVITRCPKELEEEEVCAFLFVALSKETKRKKRREHLNSNEMFCDLRQIPNVPKNRQVALWALTEVSPGGRWPASGRREKKLSKNGSPNEKRRNKTRTTNLEKIRVALRSIYLRCRHDVT